MPTTMPVETTSFASAVFPVVIGSVISGCFAVLVTLLTVWRPIKKIRVQAMVRLASVNRHDVIAETYSLLTQTFWALRRLAYPTGDEETKGKIVAAETSRRRFDEFYQQTALFLPKDIDDRIKAISDEFLVMVSDLSRYAEAVYAQDSQANDTREFYQPLHHKHRASLVDGDMDKKRQKLKQELRSYLEESEST